MGKIKHNGCGTKLYNIWVNMRRRCENPKCDHYKNYGGRGIRVCDEWQNFANFQEWALDNGYDKNKTSEECSIDRIDIDGNYCPDNCRFVGYFVQMNNRSDNHYITIGNETHTMTEWGRINNISFNTIKQRLRYGWDEEDAVTKKPDKGYGGAKLRGIPKSEEHKQKLKQSKPKYKWLLPDGSIQIMSKANASRFHSDWIELEEVI